MNTIVNHYRLINYFDVWGNVDDGFEVNNQCVEFDDLVIVGDLTDQELVDYLFGIGFFTTNDLSKFDIHAWDSDFIEFFVEETGEPLCRLERVEGI